MGVWGVRPGPGWRECWGPQTSLRLCDLLGALPDLERCCPHCCGLLQPQDTDASQQREQALRARSTKTSSELQVVSPRTLSETGLGAPSTAVWQVCRGWWPGSSLGCFQGCVGDWSQG